MSIAVIALRIVALLAFAAPLLLCDGRSKERARQGAGGRAPVIANLLVFALFLATLLLFSSYPDKAALGAALLGSIIAVVGAGLILRSRVELGPAWSLAPMADQRTGLVTTGPYRVVRHPIYLGLTLVAAGQALAFASWPALLVVLIGIIPTFAWRALAEEQLLACVFGEDYARYRRQTKMIIPYLV